jgi:hypothetical protein
VANIHSVFGYGGISAPSYHARCRCNQQARKSGKAHKLCFGDVDARRATIDRTQRGFLALVQNSRDASEVDSNEKIIYL